MTRAAVPRDVLLDRLTTELLDGDIEPGAKLPSERQLAERFQISRPVVREVLRELQERGLVEIAPGRGTFVRSVGALDAGRLVEVLYRRGQATPRHLVEARTMLERLAVTLAVERARADIAFHSLVVRAAHNPVLEIMFGSISGLVFELMLRSLGDPVVAREGIPYHRDVLDAVENRDAAAATSAMTGHLTLANRTYGEDLDESLERIARRKVDELLGRSTSLQTVISGALSQFTEDVEEPLIDGAS